MTPTNHRVPVVIGLSLAVVVTAGTAAAATRRATPPRAAVVTVPAPVSVSAVTYSRPPAQKSRSAHRPHRHPPTHRTTAPRPTAQHAAAKPRRSAPRPHRPTAVTGPTGWAALDAAIARIPTYRAGAAMWIVSSKYGYWGTADWYHDMLFIAPGVPDQRVYDVAVHEWSHELTVLDYGGDVDAAVRAMNAAFGGAGLTGAERAADCMSILQGATWTHYTACRDTAWRCSAAKLVAGRRL